LHEKREEMTTREELEKHTYWELSQKYKSIHKTGMKMPELVNRILESFTEETLMTLEVGNEICLVDNIAEYLTALYKKLKKDGVLRLAIPQGTLALKDPETKRVLTPESFQFFDSRTQNYSEHGKKRGYPPFRFMKHSMNGHTLNVELIK